jgi:opacity protein-like surface antigen
MKKFIYLLILLFSYTSYGQIGVSVGYGAGFANVSGGDPDINEGLVSSLSIGAVYSMEMIDKLNFELGASIGSTIFEDEFDNYSSLGASALLKWYVAEEFSLKGGFGFGLRLQKNDVEKKGSLAASFGVGWDITEKMVLSTGYAHQLTNSAKQDGVSIKGYSIGVGLQYFF